MLSMCASVKEQTNSRSQQNQTKATKYSHNMMQTPKIKASGHNNHTGKNAERRSGVVPVSTSQRLETCARHSRSMMTSQLSFFGMVLQFIAVLLAMVVLMDTHQVYAMSKRFLKGFIMGAMFAHHHKP